MVVCPNCGASNREASRFCSQCGDPLPQPAEATVEPQSAQKAVAEAEAAGSDRQAQAFEPRTPDGIASEPSASPGQDDVSELARLLQTDSEPPSSERQAPVAEPLSVDIAPAPLGEQSAQPAPGEPQGEPPPVEVRAIAAEAQVVRTSRKALALSMSEAMAKVMYEDEAFSKDLEARLLSEGIPATPEPATAESATSVKREHQEAEIQPAPEPVAVSGPPSEVTTTSQEAPAEGAAVEPAEQVGVPEPATESEPASGTETPVAEVHPPTPTVATGGEEPIPFAPVFLPEEDWRVAAPSPIPDSEPPETWGLLEGMRGTLPRPIGIDPPPSAQVRPTSRPVKAGQDQARLFAEVVNEPMATSYPPRPLPQPARKGKGAPWLASLLVAASVLLPFFVPGLLPKVSGAAYPGTDDARAAIEAVPANGIVVLAVEYDPALAGEMDLATRTLITELAGRKARIALVSTLPAGPAVAQRVLDEAGVADGGRGYRYGIELLNLGYLPGQEAGLKRLSLGFRGAIAADFLGERLGQYSLGQVLESAGGASEWEGHIQLIVVVAGTQDPLRWWLEQVGTQSTVPVVAAVSAAIDPGVRPYYSSGQLAGLISGRLGAAEYARAVDPSGASARDDVQLEAQSLALGSVAALIVLANLWHWGRRAFGVKEQP